jgi:hypothetical protein
MKKIAVAFGLWAAISGQTLAEDAVKPDASTSTERPVNPCSAYGEGYIAIKDGKTCIRMGGSVRHDMSLGGDRMLKKD